MIERLASLLHQSRVLGRLFHTLNYCLSRELSDCKTVLDLGCGPSSPLQYCLNIQYSLGIEAFGPYIEESKRKRIHTEYRQQHIQDLDFAPKSFDAVILIEVLEHLPEEIGYEIIKKAKQWARKKVIISSPNGFVAQPVLDDNPLQKHVSGWDAPTMKRLGFRSYGLAGLKVLRQETHHTTMGNDLMASIRFRPRIFWFAIATMSQLFTYRIPTLAFELFSVETLEAR